MKVSVRSEKLNLPKGKMKMNVPKFGEGSLEVQVVRDLKLEPQAGN